MKNLVLAAIAALFFAGCTANKPAPAEQNAQEYHHATQIKDASCPHHGMANASCAQSHGAMKECAHHGKSSASDKAHACPHHKHYNLMRSRPNLTAFFLKFTPANNIKIKLNFITK